MEQSMTQILWMELLFPNMSKEFILTPSVQYEDGDSISLKEPKTQEL
jgi:hypothetical protein